MDISLPIGLLSAFRGGVGAMAAISAAAGILACCGCAARSPEPERRVLPVKPAAAKTQELAGQNADFAFDLLRALAPADDATARTGVNVFFSPHSISTAMGMVWAGARGATERDIAGVMHWSMGQDGTHDAFAGLANEIEPPVSAADGPGTYEWASANRLWLGGEVLESFTRRLTTSYASDVERVDFLKQEETAAAINGWTERWTRGHINKIVEAKDLRDMRLMITNAVYFRGTWKEPFMTEGTTRDPFHIAPGRTETVEMMHDARHVEYAAVDGMTAVSLPYNGGVSCVFILPDEGGMEKAVGTITGSGFGTLRAGMARAEVILSIPKLKARTMFSARPALERMGMGSAFSDGADFSGISTAERLQISDVLHAATVDMDEVGTVATAVTAIGVRVTSAPMPGQLKVFNVDRPYLLALVHDGTGEVLFLGKIGDPRG